MNYLRIVRAIETKEAFSLSVFSNTDRTLRLEYDGVRLVLSNGDRKVSDKDYTRQVLIELFEDLRLDMASRLRVVLSNDDYLTGSDVGLYLPVVEEVC